MLMGVLSRVVQVSPLALGYTAIYLYMTHKVEHFWVPPIPYILPR